MLGPPDHKALTRLRSLKFAHPRGGVEYHPSVRDREFEEQFHRPHELVGVGGDACALIAALHHYRRSNSFELQLPDVGVDAGELVRELLPRLWGELGPLPAAHVAVDGPAYGEGLALPQPVHLRQGGPSDGEAVRLHEFLGSVLGLDPDTGLRAVDAHTPHHFFMPIDVPVEVWQLLYRHKFCLHEDDPRSTSISGEGCHPTFRRCIPARDFNSQFIM